MRNSLLVAILIFMSLSLFSQEIKESDIPKAVSTATNQKFAQHGRISWSKAGEIYIASFKSGDDNLKVSFTAEGSWVESKNSIDSKEMPSSSLTYLNTNFKNIKIKPCIFCERIHY